MFNLILHGVFEQEKIPKYTSYVHEILYQVSFAYYTHYYPENLYTIIYFADIRIF